MFILSLTLKNIIIGMIIPLIMFYAIKKKNQKSVKQIKPKKILIIYYIVILFLYILAIVVKLSHQNTLNESKPIPAPQIETKKEWFQGEKIFNVAKNKWEYPMDEKPINYYPIEKHNLPTKKEDGSWTIWDPNRPTWVKGEHKIERTYKFFGFNGLDQCQYPEIVPKDLPPFIKEPFNNWYYTSHMKPYNDSFTGRNKNYFEQEFREDLSNDDSKFYPYCFLKQDETIKMDYKGPKYLLEEDQDFYINTVECPLQEQKKFDTKHQNYYLHFNPVKQYITLYTEKKNVKDK